MGKILMRDMGHIPLPTGRRHAAVPRQAGTRIGEIAAQMGTATLFAVARRPRDEQAGKQQGHAAGGGSNSGGHGEGVRQGHARHARRAPVPFCRDGAR